MRLNPINVTMRNTIKKGRENIIAYKDMKKNVSTKMKTTHAAVRFKSVRCLHIVNLTVQKIVAKTLLMATSSKSQRGGLDRWESFSFFTPAEMVVLRNHGSNSKNAVRSTTRLHRMIEYRPV